MSVTDLLASFADPATIETLSLTDQLTAGLITTLLGMGVTFAALIILQLIISWMAKILHRPGKSSVMAATHSSTSGPETKIGPAAAAIQEELVAAIACAIAAKMQTSVGNIVIKNIEKIEDRSPAWSRAGIIEQMNSRF